MAASSVIKFDIPLPASSAPDVLFSFYDCDLNLIMSSERFRAFYGDEKTSQATLFGIYPELDDPSMDMFTEQTGNTGWLRNVQFQRAGEALCDLIIFRPANGFAVVETRNPIRQDPSPDEADRAFLLHEANHDALTGLPNRRQFGARLHEALSGGKNGIALMQLDLDEFKPINDTLGHAAGDIVLQQTAERIRNVLGPGETAYRLAGDEFAVIQLRKDQPSEAERLADALVNAFKKPFLVNGIAVFSGASIGVALAPRDGNEEDQLMRAADIALYAAKSEGRGRARTFEPAMMMVLEQRELLRRSLRVALQHGEFFIEYQPLVDCSGSVAGFEALLRWHHPMMGIIPPSAFIPMAEADGMMPEIGQWVLEEACRQAMTWPSHCMVAVNLSPAEFLTGGFTDRVSQTLDTIGFSAERLELEITEGVLLERTINNLDTLNTLNVLGIQISLDDFGTEYSSLSYLKNFPFDSIKIDKYFIKDLTNDDKSQTIVRFIIALAHGLGMKVTAEGVEDQAQAEWLIAAGCDRLQGYFLGRPLPASSVLEFLQRNDTAKWQSQEK
ncbi:EAL domain-containing protein (plasmid) [Rhizobium sp. CB3171]|uniref:putative bifunctional diguanylate cyclase/phosphodiesterase n=1 Tax=Rhizobium sp. CB3171 TaxID=3039157 RepID=UPI0024B2102B|nr:EAL domain-containing protein [Rhizobium sp. CB3171]WFU06563.1 EAL domain-containing protein [Rhizobium sp. CB3171]